MRRWRNAPEDCQRKRSWWFERSEEVIEDGVGQEGQQDEDGEQGGEVLPAVAVIVLKLIALDLEGIVVFVLDLPAV
jgi:hypothetical protein